MSSIISFVDVNGSLFTCNDAACFEPLQVIVAHASSLVWFAADSMIPGESSIMKGLLRSIATENVLSKYAYVELDLSHCTPQDRVAELLSHKLSELQGATSSDAVDRECVLRAGAFHVERLFSEMALNEQFSRRHTTEELREDSLGSQSPIKARYRQPGVLPSLYFSSDPDFDEPLKDDWVEIRTEAIGLNMKVSLCVAFPFNIPNAHAHLKLNRT